MASPSSEPITNDSRAMPIEAASDSAIAAKKNPQRRRGLLDRIGGGILRRATGTGNGHDEARRASTGRLASAAWRSGGLLVLFAGLAAIMTFPQVLYLGSRVPFHSDPYFSMWRLGWMAHALRHDPAHLFEANIFFPAHDTFAGKKILASKR